MNRLLSLCAGLLVLTAGCGGGGGDAATTAPPVPVAVVNVSLSSSTLVTGTTGSATAALSDARGKTLSGRSITWTSSAPSVATVDASGNVLAIAPGSAVVTATSEGRAGSAQLTVVPPPVASVSLVVSNASIVAGRTALAVAVLRDASGNVLTGRVVTWSTSNASVASVDGAGTVTGIAPGSASIIALSEGRTGTVAITVLPPPITSVVVSGSLRVKTGDSYNYVATARLADGTIVNRPVSWSIRETSRGAMTPSGTLTPFEAGSITLLATIDGAVWESATTAYDWQNLSSSGSEFITLSADNTITNKFGTSEYANLVFVCSAAGNFFGWVSTQRFVTQNGIVAFSFDGSQPIAQTWDESDNFGTLFKPGNNLVVKSFASQVAASRLFTFGFTEFQSSVKVMSFRVTGMPARLSPLLARCPGNNVVAGLRDGASDGERLTSLQALLQSPVDASELLAAQRELRAARGASSGVTPSLAGLRASTVSEQPARRRP